MTKINEELWEIVLIDLLISRLKLRGMKTSNNPLQFRQSKNSSRLELLIQRVPKISIILVIKHKVLESKNLFCKRIWNRAQREDFLHLEQPLLETLVRRRSLELTVLFSQFWDQLEVEVWALIMIVKWVDMEDMDQVDHQTAENSAD